MRGGLRKGCARSSPAGDAGPRVVVLSSVHHDPRAVRRSRQARVCRRNFRTLNLKIRSDVCLSLASPKLPWATVHELFGARNAAMHAFLGQAAHVQKVCALEAGGMRLFPR